MPDEKYFKSDEKQSNLHETRRLFLKQSSALAAITLASPVLVNAAEKQLDEKASAWFELLFSFLSRASQHSISKAWTRRFHNRFFFLPLLTSRSTRRVFYERIGYEED